MLDEVLLGNVVLFLNGLTMRDRAKCPFHLKGF